VLQDRTLHRFSRTPGPPPFPAAMNFTPAPSSTFESPRGCYGLDPVALAQNAAPLKCQRGKSRQARLESHVTCRLIQPTRHVLDDQVRSIQPNLVVVRYRPRAQKILRAACRVGQLSAPARARRALKSVVRDVCRAGVAESRLWRA
jgi:hypothetical protein